MAKQDHLERLSAGSLSQEGAELIRVLIKRQRLSQKQVEEQVGLSEGSLSRMLSRERPTSLRHLEAIAAVLRVPPADLMSAAAADAAGSAAPAADRARVIDKHRTALSNGDTPALSTGDGAGREASEPSPVGALRQQGHLVFRQGSPVDPRRPGDGVGGGFYEVRPLAPDESIIVGREGFGVAVSNDSMSNWEGDDGQLVRVGAIVWCDPDKRADVRDGRPVVAFDPVDGLTLGVYREQADGVGIVLETDEPGVPVERRHCEPDWIIGPIVYVTAVGGRPRRRARGQPPGHADPAGYTFVSDRNRATG